MRPIEAHRKRSEIVDPLNWRTGENVAHISLTAAFKAIVDIHADKIDCKTNATRADIEEELGRKTVNEITFMTNSVGISRGNTRGFHEPIQYAASIERDMNGNMHARIVAACTEKQLARVAKYATSNKYAEMKLDGRMQRAIIAYRNRVN